LEFHGCWTNDAVAVIVPRVNETLNVIAAWAGLGISAVTFWFAVIRPSRQAKAANPTAQLDLLNYETKSGWHEEVRMVVTNAGPATMENVTVVAFDGDGMDLTEAEPGDITALWPKMPVSHLHVGQSLPLTLSPSLGTPDPKAAVIRWRDGRDDEQSRRFELTYNRVAEQV
jgi:hypothetical protein